jgi:hypothetical protein
VVRVPGYRRRCVVLPVRYELNLYMLCRRKWSSGQSSWLQKEMCCASCEVRTEFIFVM